MIESLQGRANQLDGFHGSLMCWTQCDICVVQCVSNDVCTVRTVQDVSRTYSVMYDVVFLIPAYVRYYKKKRAHFLHNEVVQHLCRSPVV